ncbi:MAG: DMT family transporter [Hyphomicrobiaceae bacterium]
MFVWLLLASTVVFEVAGSTMLKLSQGFTLIGPTAGVFICYAIAFTGLAIVLKEIELSIAYAIWSGAGTALTAVIGIWAFGESVTVLKMVSLGLVIAGVVGLQLSAGSSH